MTDRNSEVVVSWGGRIARFGEVLGQLELFLDVLQALHPCFSHWQVFDNVGDLSPPFPGREIMSHWQNDEKPGGEKRSDLFDVGPSREVTSATWSPDGFDGYFVAGGTKVITPDEPSGNSIGFSFNIASDQTNSVKFAIPSSMASEYGLQFLRKLLLTVAQFWHADLGKVVIVQDMRAFMRAPNRRPYGLILGWLTYLRNPYFRKSVTAGGPCPIEPIGVDAVLIAASDEPLDLSNIAELQRAELVQTWFDQFHFHHRFTFHGWPYDEEDETYAHQITGAPRGTVYTVAFVPFDGYDWQRKVLLYARLFRSPPNPAVDLSPNVKKDRDRRENTCFVVQARQQLAAVRHAGARHPIEWHVGVEATANSLSTLLNDWAGIPPEELRVVYTPFEGESHPLH